MDRCTSKKRKKWKIRGSRELLDSDCVDLVSAGGSPRKRRKGAAMLGIKTRDMNGHCLFSHVRVFGWARNGARQ